MIKKIEQLPISATNWIGTPSSIIVHTLVFILSFASHFLFGASMDSILLILTTAVSLEAIYLAIFIQMTVNKNLQSTEVIHKEVKEIGDDVEEISTDVDGISEDIEDISEDIEDISEDIDKIQEEDKQDEVADEKTKMTLEKIENRLQKILSDIESLKQGK